MSVGRYLKPMVIVSGFFKRFLIALNAMRFDCIVSDDSVERIECLYHELVDLRHGREDISFRSKSFSMDTEFILSTICTVFKVERSSLYQRRRNSFLRPMAAKFLCEFGGLTQREAGVLLKIGNGASVSKQLKKLSSALKGDLSLQTIHAEIGMALKLKERADP